MNLYPVILLNNLKAKEEVKLTYHAHVELVAHHIFEFIYKRHVSGTKNNIINVYLYHQDVSLVFLDEERLIYCPSSIVIGKKILRETIIPSSWGLVQAIESFI